MPLICIYIVIYLLKHFLGMYFHFYQNNDSKLGVDSIIFTFHAQCSTLPASSSLDIPVFSGSGFHFSVEIPAWTQTNCTIIVISRSQLGIMRQQTLLMNRFCIINYYINWYCSPIKCFDADAPMICDCKIEKINCESKESKKRTELK